MHFLRSGVDIEKLDGLISRVQDNPLLQGVVLDLNPVWFMFYRIERAGLNVSAPPHIFFSSSPLNPFLHAAAALNQVNEGWIDLDWKNTIVDEWCHAVFGRSFGPMSPFLVKFVALPLLDSNLKSYRETLVSAAREAEFPTIVETRPRAEMVLSCGDACKDASGMQGTIGGFLKDSPTRKIYASTCGHVVSSGNVTIGGRVIGQCAHARAPLPLQRGQRCSRHDPGANRLDLALIDVTGSPVTNKASTIAQDVYPQEPVTVDGAASRTVSYQVGGACITYQIGGACFTGLFELRPPAPAGLVSARLQTLGAKVPKPGDSGAWVLRSGTRDWCGILVGADHLMGYAMESDSVIREANGAFNVDLTLA